VAFRKKRGPVAFRPGLWAGLAFLFVFTRLIIGRNTYKFQSPISSITYTGQDIEFVEYWISLRGWDGCFGS
jgi:hypothetical protein